MFSLNIWAVVSLLFGIIIVCMVAFICKMIVKYYPYLKAMDKKMLDISKKLITLDQQVYDLSRSYRLVQKRIMRDVFGEDGTHIRRVMYGEEQEEELPFIQKNMFTEELKKNRKMEFDTARRKALSIEERMKQGLEMKEISIKDITVEQIENTVELDNNEECPTLVNPDHTYVVKFNQARRRTNKYEDTKTS